MNWTNIEREYLRLFPNLLILDDDNSSLLSGGGPNSITNAFSFDEEQALVDQDLDDMDEETPTMVKSEAPARLNDIRSLLEVHKQILLSAASTSNQANSSSSTVNSTPTTISEQSASTEHAIIPTTLPAVSSTTEHKFQPHVAQMPQQAFSNQIPIMNLRSIVAQMDSTQRKKSMVSLSTNVLYIIYGRLAHVFDQL